MWERLLQEHVSKGFMEAQVFLAFVLMSVEFVKEKSIYYLVFYLLTVSWAAV